MSLLVTVLVVVVVYGVGLGVLAGLGYEVFDRYDRPNVWVIVWPLSLPLYFVCALPFVTAKRITRAMRERVAIKRQTHKEKPTTF